MKHNLSWMLFILAVFACPVQAQAGETEDFMRGIIDTPPPTAIYATGPICPVSGKKGVYELITAEASPEEFMRKLRAAWRSENTSDREYSLEFVWYNEHLLPLTEEDYQALADIALHDPKSDCRYQAVRCLGSIRREEFLPTLRAALADSHIYVVSAALEALAGYGDALPEEDVQRIIDHLTDSRKRLGTILPFGDWTDWYLTSDAMRALQSLGPRASAAREVILREFVLPEMLAAYDEAKFVAFLEKIQEPGLTAESFWKHAEEAGVPLRIMTASGYIRLRGEPPRKMPWEDKNDEDARFTEEEDEEEPEEDMEWDDDSEDFYSPDDWSPEDREDFMQEKRRDFSCAPLTGETLLAIVPDDRLGLYLLLQTILLEYECVGTEAHDRPWKFDKWWGLFGRREMIPILELIRHDPELIDKYRDRRSESWYRDRLAEDTAEIILYILENDLSERECLFYIEEFWKLPERSMSSLERRLAEYQEKHEAVLIPLMKARIAEQDGRYADEDNFPGEEDKVERQRLWYVFWDAKDYLAEVLTAEQYVDYLFERLEKHGGAIPKDYDIRVHRPMEIYAELERRKDDFPAGAEAWLEKFREKLWEDGKYDRFFESLNTTAGNEAPAQ